MEMKMKNHACNTRTVPLKYGWTHITHNCNLYEPFWKLFHLSYFVEFHCTIVVYNLGRLVRVGPMLLDGG